MTASESNFLGRSHTGSSTRLHRLYHQQYEHSGGYLRRAISVQMARSSAATSQGKAWTAEDQMQNEPDGTSRSASVIIGEQQV